MSASIDVRMTTVNFTVKPLKNNNLNACRAVALQRNKNRVMLRASKYRWGICNRRNNAIKPYPPSRDQR